MLQLVDNAVAILLLPLPNALQEFLAAQIITSLALFFFNYLFYFNLSCQSCMVIAGHPQGIVAHHAVPTNQNILQSIVQGMAHVQLASDIRRRNNNAKCFVAFLYLSMKITILFPELIPLLLYGSRVIHLRNIMFLAHYKSSLK